VHRARRVRRTCDVLFSVSCKSSRYRRRNLLRLHSIAIPFHWRSCYLIHAFALELHAPAWRCCPLASRCKIQNSQILATLRRIRLANYERDKQRRTHRCCRFKGAGSGSRDEHREEPAEGSQLLEERICSRHQAGEEQRESAPGVLFGRNFSIHSQLQTGMCAHDTQEIRYPLS